MAYTDLALSLTDCSTMENWLLPSSTAVLGKAGPVPHLDSAEELSLLTGMGWWYRRVDPESLRIEGEEAFCLSCDGVCKEEILIAPHLSSLAIYCRYEKLVQGTWPSLALALRRVHPEPCPGSTTKFMVLIDRRGVSGDPSS